MEKTKKRNGADQAGEITRIEKLIQEGFRDEAYQGLQLLSEKNQFGYSLFDCEKLIELYTEMKLKVPNGLIQREFTLQKATNSGLVDYLISVLNKEDKLPFEKVWPVIQKRALSFSKEQQEEILNLISDENEKMSFEMTIEAGQKKLAHAATELAVSKKWTIWDFSRLFIVLIIPAGMIFSQYYFWADLSSFARANLQLLIGFMEIVTGLTLWGLLSIFFAYRADRMKLPKAGYDVLVGQINAEQKIKALEKATKWELSDLLQTLGIFIAIGVLVALFLDNFVLPYIPEYTTLVIPIIGLGVFVWLVLGFRKEKKEVCAQQIAALKQYL